MNVSRLINQLSSVFHPDRALAGINTMEDSYLALDCKTARLRSTRPRSR